MEPDLKHMNQMLKSLERAIQPTLGQRIFSALVGMMIFTIFMGTFVWAAHQLSLFFSG